MHNIFPAVALLLCLGLASGETLNRDQVHSEYSEGNFDQVVMLLNEFMLRNKVYDREDSIFIAKHLAVVYSANPATREKGKYYMMRLLELVPSAKLVDMYVSDEIDHIFDRVKEEYLMREQALGKSEPMPPKTASDPIATSAINREPNHPKEISQEKKSSHTGYWVAAGGAGVVLAGLTAYFFLHQDTPSADKVYFVP